MLIYVCSCCYNPEILTKEYLAESLGIPYVASHRKDGNPGYFIIEAGNDPPIFHNNHGVPKLNHEFLLKMGYEWEETRPATEDPQTKEVINPLGWWHDPKSRKVKLEIVPKEQRN